jgi:hypothetical protein
VLIIFRLPAIAVASPSRRRGRRVAVASPSPSRRRRVAVAIAVFDLVRTYYYIIIILA